MLLYSPLCPGCNANDTYARPSTPPLASPRLGPLSGLPTRPRARAATCTRHFDLRPRRGRRPFRLLARHQLLPRSRRCGLSQSARGTHAALLRSRGSCRLRGVRAPAGRAARMVNFLHPPSVRASNCSKFQSRHGRRASGTAT